MSFSLVLNNNFTNNYFQVPPNLNECLAATCIIKFFPSWGWLVFQKGEENNKGLQVECVFLKNMSLLLLLWIIIVQVAFCFVNTLNELKVHKLRVQMLIAAFLCHCLTDVRVWERESERASGVHAYDSV